MESTHSPSRNQVLAALPVADFERLSPSLELVSLPAGKLLYESGRTLRYGYFPTTAVIALHHTMKCGAMAESAGVGNEGMVGVSLLMGDEPTPISALVQSAGHAYRVPAELLKREFRRAGVFQDLMLHYFQALISEMSQTAACNRHHSVGQQLCRCLLLNLDRLQTDELCMTHELAASLLGVRREGVSLAAAKLQDAGYISYRRGHITVTDRSGLEASACECYAVVKDQWSRLESHMHPAECRV